MSNPIVLIPLENPPENYVYSLKLVGLDCECTFSPTSLEKYSGLLLTGGGDFLSSFYNSNATCKNVNVIRDENEFRILDHFAKKSIPILGVCRGMQIINLYLGGTLKNVNRHQSKAGNDVYHPVVSSCKFFNSLSSVNSCHLQCVDKLTHSATDVLTAKDGVVEGFLAENIIAVQFHPERMNAKAISIVYGGFAQLVKSYFTCCKL